MQYVCDCGQTFETKADGTAHLASCGKPNRSPARNSGAAAPAVGPLTQAAKLTADEMAEAQLRRQVAAALAKHDPRLAPPPAPAAKGPDIGDKVCELLAAERQGRAPAEWATQ